MDIINNELNLLNLPIELIQLIIINSSKLTKFVMHFVTKFFWNLTKDSRQNRVLGLSFMTYHKRTWGNNQGYNICQCG